MSGPHCYLAQPPACSCGWNYLVYLAWRLSSAFFEEEEEVAEAGALDVLDVDWWTADSLPYTQKNKSAFLIYLDRNPWKPNAGGEGWEVTPHERLANSTWSESNPLLLFSQFSWYQWSLWWFVVSIQCNPFNGCHGGVCDNIKCKLRVPLSSRHYHSPSDAADRQNTVIILSLS